MAASRWSIGAPRRRYTRSAHARFAGGEGDSLHEGLSHGIELLFFVSAIIARRRSGVFFRQTPTLYPSDGRNATRPPSPPPVSFRRGKPGVGGALAGSVVSLVKGIWQNQAKYSYRALRTPRPVLAAPAWC